MKKLVQLLLVTSPVEERGARGVLAVLRKAARGVRLVRIAEFTKGGGRGVLTPRQTQVLRGIAVGMSMKEIALLLGVASKTVETHRTQLMRRVGIVKIPELVRFAIQTGVLPAAWLAKRPRPSRRAVAAPRTESQPR